MSEPGQVIPQQWVEVVAREIFATEGAVHMEEGCEFEPVTWEELGDPEYPVERERYRTMARAAIAAVAPLIRADERERMRPRRWTGAMSDAWHQAIPDTIKAFDDLIAARGQNDGG